MSGSRVPAASHPHRAGLGRAARGRDRDGDGAPEGKPLLPLLPSPGTIAEFCQMEGVVSEGLFFPPQRRTPPVLG